MEPNILDYELYEEEVAADVSESDVVMNVGQQKNATTSEQMEIELDYAKCVICRKHTTEHASEVAVGLPTLLQHLEVTGRFEVIEHIDLHKHDKVTLLHLSCRRQLAYEAVKCKKMMTDRDVQLKKKDQK